MEVKGDLNIDGTLTVNGAPVSGGSGISNVVEDTTPQLGGDLDVNGKAIEGVDATGGGDGGDLDIHGGNSDTGRAGDVTISGGSGTAAGGIGGGVSLSAGDGDTSGSDVTITGGFGSANGGSVTISPGGGGVGGDGIVFIGRGLDNGSIVSIVDPIVMLGRTISNMADPVNAQDATTKHYVDVRFQQFYSNLGTGGSVSGDSSPTLGGDLNVNDFTITGPGDLNFTSPNGMTFLAGTDNSGGPPDFIQIQTDLAFYAGADSGGIGIAVGESVDGNGGSIAISAGQAVNTGDGGNVSIVGGDTNSGTGGSVVISPGNSVIGDGGSITLGLGAAASTIQVLDPIVMNNKKITNLGTPTNAADAVTKAYADGLTTGGGGGFYGIVWSDGTVTKRTDRLSFNGTEFYLDGQKPTLNIKESGIDHNLLSNLTAGDPHTQYIRADGTRSFTGAQSMGSNKLTNVTDPTSAQDAATKNYVDSTMTPGFYGLIVKQSVGGTTFKKDTLIFGSDFYLKANSKGAPTVNFRGVAASAAASGVTFSDGTSTYSSQTTLGFSGDSFYLSRGTGGRPVVNLRGTADDGVSIYAFNNSIGFSNTNFYLSRGTGGKPVVNLRQSLEPLSAYLDLATVSKVALETFAEHTAVIEDISVVCRAGSATAGFYIVTAANPTYRDGTRVTGADPVTISSTPQLITPTANKTLSPGDALFLNLYVNGNAKGVRVKVRLRRS